jgi:hypothetical protein
METDVLHGVAGALAAVTCSAVSWRQNWHVHNADCSNNFKARPIYSCAIYPLCVKCFRINSQFPLWCLQYSDSVLCLNVLSALGARPSVSVCLSRFSKGAGDLHDRGGVGNVTQNWTGVHCWNILLRNNGRQVITEKKNVAQNYLESHRCKNDLQRNNDLGSHYCSRHYCIVE